MGNHVQRFTYVFRSWRHRRFFWVCPEVVVAKRFCGVKYHINKICPDLGIEPKEVRKFFFFQNSQKIHNFFILSQVQGQHLKKKKKSAYATKNLPTMWIYFILRNAIAHC